MNLKGFVKTDEKLRNYRKETWRKQLKSTTRDDEASFLYRLLSKALWTSKEKRKVAKLRSSHAEDVLYHTSGSAWVFGYTVYRGFLNRIYGILQLKDEYSVYHFL